MSCSIALSSHTLVPSTNTAPDSRDTVCIPANRSPVLAARVRAAASCDSPSTLMPSAGTSLSLGHVSEVFCTQKDTNGGSSETGTKVLAARPTRTPSTSAAIARTPAGKCPKASRRLVGLRSLDAIGSIFTRRAGAHRQVIGPRLMDDHVVDVDIATPARTKVHAETAYRSSFREQFRSLRRLGEIALEKRSKPGHADREEHTAD